MNVSIVDDVAVENAEEFYLQLSTSDTSVELSSICSRATFSISDSDGENYVRLKSFYFSVVTQSVAKLSNDYNLFHLGY